jgi:hypothetical protein
MKSRAYLTSLQLYAEAARKGLMKRVSFEQYSEREYEKFPLEQEVRYQPENIIILQQGLMSREDLSAASVKLLIKISSELCMNNALWYHEARTGPEKAAIAQLRREEILYKTEDSHIHYVDPRYIRKGSKPAVLALTTAELETVGRVSRENIRNLGTRKIDINMLDMSTIPDIEPNI